VGGRIRAMVEWTLEDTYLRTVPPKYGLTFPMFRIIISCGTSFYGMARIAKLTPYPLKKVKGGGSRGFFIY
jgi:hypothetical protein